MKYIFFIATLALQLLAVVKLKLLDNFRLIACIFLLSLFIGILMRFSKAGSNVTTANIGWGLIYGSLASIVLVAIFMIQLFFNFPR